MSMQTRLQDLATRVATECKSIRTLVNGNAANLAALNTTAKGNLVAALNELKGEIDALALAAGATINDASSSSTTQTWSINKISSELAAAVAALVASAPSALNTLDELANALGDDANFATTIATALGNRVRTDTAAQGLNGTQQTNARTNIAAVGTAEIGDPDTNFVTGFDAGLT
jgi:hypothetical protein